MDCAMRTGAAAVVGLAAPYMVQVAGSTLLHGFADDFADE